jgi:hypothetical protein
MMAGNSSFLTVEKTYGRHDGRPFTRIALFLENRYFFS